jgi:hypothetical protein
MAHERTGVVLRTREGDPAPLFGAGSGGSVYDFLARALARTTA